MIKLIMGCAKVGVLAVVIMLISQIPVGTRRICDHVYDATQSRLVLGPVHWIADRFDFSAQERERARAGRLESRTARASKPAGLSRESESDREKLSGLLKSPGH